MNHNDNPIISIIIPNYNNGKSIGKCIESCLNQTYQNIEIIIIDDCSSDDSINIIKEYQEIDERIKLIQNETNQKVARTRHIGILNSSAEWITTLDSDDFYISELKIQKEVEVLSKHNFESNIIAFSGIVLTDENSNALSLFMHKDNIKEGNIFRKLLLRKGKIPRDFIFSKKLYFEVGGFDPGISLYEDWDLKIRLSKKGKFYFSGINGIG